MASHITIFLIWCWALGRISETLQSEGFGHEDAAIVSQLKYPASLPILEFPKPFVGLVRRKRDWVIPPINIPENDRGLFPKNMVQIRSNNDKEVKIMYSITGPGADKPPVGLFFVDINSGTLYVTKPLDRERQDQYLLVAHAVSVGADIAEETMEIIVQVIDMNDNKPVFTQDPFIGTVPEASLPGFEVMQVTATDADEPGSANSDVRYTIINQEPELPSRNMFVINPDHRKTVSVPENNVNAPWWSKMPVVMESEPHPYPTAVPQPLDFEKDNRYTLLVDCGE
ncbi:cadherin-1-like [Salvelinus sp. IW2-2015]|uniref:cadherin-1-like n=1 Tax=Salvelinus sp. IW2-2015 TaxID=2691554 RepID=UPI0038D48109